MVIASCRTLLVAAVGQASLLPAALLPTRLTAVVLPPVTVTADPEDTATAAGTTNSLTENNFGADRHPRPKAGLDNGDRSWQVVIIADDGYLMKVCHRDPGRSHGRGPTSRLWRSSYQRSDDDGCAPAAQMLICSIFPASV